MSKKIKKINEGFEDFIPDDYDPDNARTLTREEEAALGIPSPEELARQLRKRRVTINLDESIVRFFKSHADRFHVPYQTLMREVLRRYTADPQLVAKWQPVGS